MSIRPKALLAVSLFFLFWLIPATLFTVNETEQALIVRLGAPIEAITAPGLKLKMPLVDSIIYFDARLLTMELPLEQVILGDQKRLEVKTYTRYRISDPLRFYQAVRTPQLAIPQISQLVSSSLRRELGQVALPLLLSKERTRIVDNIRQDVAEKAREIGIEVVEVRFLRADLPLETSLAIYDRMKSERQREAKELRAKGFEWAQKIQANADRERTVLLSEAQRNATITRGLGEAEASGILADAFSQDPQFYKLFRTLQTYRQTLADANPTIVLSPEAAFLHDFKAGPGVSPKHP